MHKSVLHLACVFFLLVREFWWPHVPSPVLLTLSNRQSEAADNGLAEEYIMQIRRQPPLFLNTRHKKEEEARRRSGEFQLCPCMEYFFLSDLVYFFLFFPHSFGQSLIILIVVAVRRFFYESRVAICTHQSVVSTLSRKKNILSA